MVELGSVIQTVLSLLPAEAQSVFFREFKISSEAVSSPAGAILMGMYVLEYVGFAKHVDALLEEKHTTIEELKAQFMHGKYYPAHKLFRHIDYYRYPLY